jgi:hypothetical protein
MPNDARVGFFIGMLIVAGLAIVYRGQPPETTIDAQMPRQPATRAAAETGTNLPAQSQPVSPSFPAAQETRGDDLVGKEDPAHRENGDPNSPHQKKKE